MKSLCTRCSFDTVLHCSTDPVIWETYSSSISRYCLSPLSYSLSLPRSTKFKWKIKIFHFVLIFFLSIFWGLSKTCLRIFQRIKTILLVLKHINILIPRTLASVWTGFEGRFAHSASSDYTVTNCIVHCSERMCSPTRPCKEYWVKFGAAVSVLNSLFMFWLIVV